MSDPTPEQKPPDSIEAIRAEIAAQPINERQLLEQIVELMKDEKGRKLFLRLMSVSKTESVRPETWSKASVSPYFRKKFAEELKPSIDLIIQDHQDRVFMYSEAKISKKSLHLKIFQAFDFLVKVMDAEDFRYRTAREHIVISKEKHGIRLSWTENAKLGVALKVTYGGDSLINLLEAIDEFIEKSPNGTKFERTDVQLSEDEINRIKDSVSGLINIRATVEPRRVRLLKLSQDQIEMLAKGL